jgi:hypothetical protein
MVLLMRPHCHRIAFAIAYSLPFSLPQSENRANVPVFHAQSQGVGGLVARGQSQRQKLQGVYEWLSSLPGRCRQ